MVPPFYTFQEVIKYNNHDWNRAYEVLNYYLQKGDFQKDIRGPEDIVYHNLGKIEPFDLAYARVFYADPRGKRPRISTRDAE